jgi:hypothetical protein
MHNFTWWVAFFFNTRLASSYVRKADSYTCRMAFDATRVSSYACWQVRTLQLASQMIVMHSTWSTPKIRGLPSAHAAPRAATSPLFQECRGPLDLTYHITMWCRNVGIPCSNVIECRETPHWLLFYPKSRNLSKHGLTSKGVWPNLTKKINNFCWLKFCIISPKKETPT